MRATSFPLGELFFKKRDVPDFNMLRHHVFVKVHREVQLAEVGPRFEMKRERDRISSLPVD